MGISKISAFIQKHFYLTLIVTTLISYGQMLGMYVWKDDNAIFFKFDHLAEPAGYLGRGLLGEGPYRLSVAPYWFIYKLFGSDFLFPYYVLALFFYIFAAYSIYKLFETFISKRAGQIASLLFACGYVASEGFYWLASSWILSVSIFLTAFAVRSYFQFVQKPTGKLYLQALVLYVLCIVVTPVRTHYVIGLILAIEAIWGIQAIQLKAMLNSILRLLPFIGVFYWLYLVGADSRTASLGTYLVAIKNHTWYDFYSFFVTAGNIFLTDIQSNFIFLLLKPLLSFSFGSLLFKFGTTLIASIILWRTNKKPKGKLLLLIFLILCGAWSVLSKSIISSPQISLYQNAQLVLFLGGMILLTLFFTSVSISKWRVPLFLLIWFCLNLAVYTSYISTSYYASIDRYIAHSFVAFIGILAFFSDRFRKTKILLFFLVLWGVVNLYASAKSQYLIVQTRSNPVRTFYTDLKTLMPNLQKGEIVYIDVAQSEREHFASAFSVGQMPESTAIAWRYGLDRYDFLLASSFKDLTLTKEQTLQYAGNTHTFFYNQGHLVDTSNEYKTLKGQQSLNIGFDQKETKGDINIIFKTPLSSVRPIRVKVEFTARALQADKIQFPIDKVKNSKKTLYSDTNFRTAAYLFESERQNFNKNAVITASSEWQDRIISNLTDNNVDTVWQPDRIKWHEGNEGFTIDLKQVQNIDRVIWFNGFENNSPTKYSILTSVDGKSFQQGASVSEMKKLPSNTAIETKIPQTEARYIKMLFHSSLNDDSPGIAEAFPVTSKYSAYSINDVMQFLASPFNYVPDSSVYNELVRHFSRSAKMHYSWLTNKQNSFETTSNSNIITQYDDRVHKYELMIPSGGTKFTQLTLHPETIPGTIKINKIDIAYD